jgi:predicted aspartyl protease
VLESIPIKFVDNYIFIEATVNNREKSLNFLFDTGAGITVIDTKIADQLLLEINSEAKINTSGKSLLSKESTGNKMKLGRKIILDSINLILMDLNHLSTYLKTNVDGVIGYDLLNRFITESNIDEGAMKFYEPSTYTYKGDSEPLELTTLESNLFGIEIHVVPKNSRETIVLNLEIDTGADNYLSFHNETVNKHQFIREGKKQKYRRGFGADSTITTNIKDKLKSVSFGGKKWTNIPVILEVDPVNKRENSLADGLIGQRLLLDFNIIYNLEKRVMYLENRK